MKTSTWTEYGPDDIHALITELESADLLAGHHICGFDMLVLEKLHGYDVTKHKYFDTTAMSRAIYPGSSVTSTLRIKDARANNIPQEYWGRHSLKAWSLRLKMDDEGKDDYDGGWESWSEEMQAYCVRDVQANKHLLTHLLSKGWPVQAHHTESMMSYLLSKQEEYGVGFDEDRAISLMVDLAQKRADIERELCKTFPPITVAKGPPKVAKADRTCRKYKEGEEGWFPPRVKGEKYQLYQLQEFNPASTQHIAKRLTDLYGWEPQDFTPGGQAQVTDVILRDLPWPEAQQCADYQVIKKTLAYVSEGKTAWLKLVKNGRIHGQVKATGAVTNRASHSNPNLANVPKVGKAYGKECRELFIAGGGAVPKDYVLVGCDAKSLQLAIYAHYVSKYDQGELAKLVEYGDPHEYMRMSSGLHYRENQKTLTYATWFGAQHYKQGTIVLNDWRMAYDNGLVEEPAPPMSKAGALGKAVDVRMRQNMKGFSKMNEACEKAGKRGYIFGLDGRKIPVQQQRLALLSLLQGNEAVIMKNAYVLACEVLATEIKEGLAHPCLWIHDEFQWACAPDYTTSTGMALTRCITEAGKRLGLRLRLGAKYKIGETWAQTH